MCWPWEEVVDADAPFETGGSSVSYSMSMVQLWICLLLAVYCNNSLWWYLCKVFIKFLSGTKFKSWRQISIHSSHFFWFTENCSNYSSHLWLRSNLNSIDSHRFQYLPKIRVAGRHGRKDRVSDWAVLAFSTQSLKRHIILPRSISHMTSAVSLTDEISMNTNSISWPRGIRRLLSKVQT